MLESCSSSKKQGELRLVLAGMRYFSATASPAMWVESATRRCLALIRYRLSKVKMAARRPRLTKRTCHVWAFKVGHDQT